MKRTTGVIHLACVALVGLVGTLALSAPGAEPRSFDYVVVGAGASGSVVAARLSEHPDRTVLVVEAGGPDDDPRIHRPSAFRSLMGSPVDWHRSTAEEPHLGGRRITWPLGKVWGGGGSLSAMVYVRGHPRDFDRWSELGNAGWAWADVLPYFRKAQNQERGPSAYHGVGGPQNVADPRWVPPISRAFLEAAVEIGLPRNPDFNGARQEGAGLFQLNQKNGERHSAAAAYLRPALRRPNLTIESRALATRILFDGSRAVGLRYVQRGETREVTVGRELILCAGTVHTPHLLMLSGVGPAKPLGSLGIAVVRDLPGVGQNLWDHPRVAAVFESTRPLGFETPADEEQARRDYDLNRTGPLASNGVGAGAFVRTSPDATLPDVELFLTADPARGVFSVHAALMRPQSRGRVELHSADPREPPKIHAGYLAEERDLEVLIRGLRIARRLARTEALSGYRGRELGPGSAVDNEAALRSYVREHVTTFFHPVGTSRMGSDPQAVVDDQLRVRGLEGLRVVDASIMPTPIGGATHAAAVMIAEKGADLIKRGW
jgi:choline dehydrogenase